MPTFTTAYPNLYINSHAFPVKALVYSSRQLHTISTWNHQHSSFYLGQPPHSPYQFHQLPYIHAHVLASSFSGANVLLLFMIPFHLCPKPFPPKMLKAFALAVTDFSALYHLFLPLYKMISSHPDAVTHFKKKPLSPIILPATTEFLNIPHSSLNSSILLS